MSETPEPAAVCNDSITVQFAVRSRRGIPAAVTLRRWALAALQPGRESRELCLRIVDESAMQGLNRDYRGRDRGTNVLSFPGVGRLPGGIEHLGDVVVCAAVAEREAWQQGKAVRDHWAHLVVHGSLHLQGLDHIKPCEAAIMEAREREILAGLGIPDPYRMPPSHPDAARAGNAA